MESVPGCRSRVTVRPRCSTYSPRSTKNELREALADPGQLPDNELFKAVQFSDGSNAAFLRRLWHDLYGGEPRTSAT